MFVIKEGEFIITFNKRIQIKRRCSHQLFPYIMNHLKVNYRQLPFESDIPKNGNISGLVEDENIIIQIQDATITI